MHSIKLCLLYLITLLSLKAEDHQAWALQLQEKSQEFIKTHQQEAHHLASQSKAVKGCQVGKPLGCSKKPTASQSLNPQLFVFVSLSMPKETLKALAQSTRQQKGVLVIRGLIDNSFQKTAKLIQEVGEGVVLDPTLFKEYDIKVVPTFVLKHKDDYRRISGNVSLKYALEKLKGEDE